MISPLSCIKFSRTKTLWNIECFVWEKFRYSETKKLTENYVACLLSTKLANTPNQWNSQRFSNETFCYCDTNKFPTENRFSPPLLNWIFWCPILSETLKGSPAKLYPSVRQKGWQNLRYTPLMHKMFWCPKLSETLNGSPTNFFGNVRQKFFDKKSW